MSLINETILASITIDCLKNTELWKSQQDYWGNVPNHIMYGMLDILGFDVKRTTKKETTVSILKDVMVRDKKNPRFGYKTTVLTGKLKANCPWKRAFQKVDVVTPEDFSIPLDQLFLLEDFGVDAVVWRKLNAPETK